MPTTRTPGSRAELPADRFALSRGRTRADRADAVAARAGRAGAFRVTAAAVIVNYDNFDIPPPASARFFAMVEQNERYSLSRTRYSTNAFFRRRLGAQSTAASLDHRLYGSFAEARAGIPTHGRRPETSEAPTTRPLGESCSQSGADRS